MKLTVLKGNNTEQLEAKFDDFAAEVSVQNILTNPKEPNWLYVFWEDRGASFGIEEELPAHIRKTANGRYFNEETNKIVAKDSWKQ